MSDPFLEASRASADPDPFLAAAQSAAPAAVTAPDKTGFFAGLGKKLLSDAVSAEPQEEDPFLAAAQAQPAAGDDVTTYDDLTVLDQYVEKNPAVTDDPFLAAAKGEKSSASVLQKAQAALGRGFKEGGRLISGVSAQFGKLAPYEVHINESGKVALRDITPEIEQRKEQIVASVNKFADDFMYASEEDRQPGNLAEHLAYGMVEFLPLAPVYSFLGGPAARVVARGLTAISQRFGPVIAKQAAERLPVAIQRAGKYLGEVGAHGLEAGAMGAGAEIVAGSSAEQSLYTGIAFGAFSMAFKGFLKDPAKALKKAAWDAPIPKTEKIIDPIEKAAGVVDPQMEDIRRHGFERAEPGAKDDFQPYVHPEWFKDMQPSAKALEVAERPEVSRGAKEGKIEELHSLGSAFSSEGAQKSRVKEAEDYLKANGYEIVGLQEHPRHGEMFWFTDPKTGSTLLMPVEQMAPEGITKHVQESRAKFGVADPVELHSLGSIFKKPTREWAPDDHIRVNERAGGAAPVETFYDYAFSRLQERSPAAHSAFVYSRKMGQQLRDFLDLNGIPALTRLGVADPAFEHGGAHLAAPRIADDLIAKVMGPADYRDWQKKSMLTGILVKDRILAGHEYNAKLRNDALLEAQRKAGEAQAAQEDIYLYETEHPNHLTVEQTGHLQGLYDKRNDLLREKAVHDQKAQEQHEIVTEIEQTHNIRQYDWDVRDAMRRDHVTWTDAEGREIARLDDVRGKVNAWNEHVTPKLDELWKQAKNIDPAAELEATGTYGKYTAARISLVHKDAPSLSGATGRRLQEETTSPSLDARITEAVDKALSSDAKGGQARGTADVARDPKDRRAYFSGNYTLSMEKNLNNTIRQRLEIATKENLYKALEDRGVVKFDEVTARDLLPEGVEWVKWKEKVKRPESSVDPEAGGAQRTALVDRDMWVRSDAMTDLQGVLNVGVNMKPIFAVQLATRVQLFQVVDFVTHAKNLLSEEARSQGKGKRADVLTRIPGIATGDAIGRIYKAFHEVRADSPDIRAEMAFLGKLGVLRPAHGQDAILPTGKWLWEIDTATRVLMNRQFDNLVQAGKVTNSVTNRRNFINQVGQYNDRFMGPWMRWARRTGFSPFIVAGRTFNRNATRTLTGNPGAETTGPEAETDMRRLNLMTAAMSATIPMMVNAWTTGNPMGRPGTPLFGIDIGRKEKDDGTHDVIDLGQVSGLARATRNWGIADTYQGLRAGQTPEQIGSKAALTVTRGRSHPWTGPGPSFALDWHKEGAKKAVEKINPTIVNPLSGESKYGFFETKLSPESGDRTALSRVGTGIDTLLSSPAGAFGYKDVRPQRSAAEQYVSEHRFKTGEISEEKMRHRKVRERAEALLKEDEQKGFEYLQAQIDAGKIETDYAERVVRDLPLSKLQRGFASLSAKHEKDTALEAYRLANIREKAQLFRLLEQKIDNQEGNIGEEKMSSLTSFLDAAHLELTKAIAARKITREEIYEKE